MPTIKNDVATEPQSEKQPVSPTPPAKAKRERSPNHPSIGLKSAMALAKKIYDADKRSPMPAEAAIKHLDFDSLTGPASRALATLKMFGLLTEQDGQYRVSEDAVTVWVYPEGSPDRDVAIQKMARKPAIFQDVLRHFGPDGLPSDQTLKAHLMMKMGFTEGAVPGFIAALRETIPLANGTSSDYDAGGAMNPGAQTAPPPLSPLKPPVPLPSGGGTVHVWSLAPGVTAELRSNAPLTQAHFDLLTKYVDLAKAAAPAADPAK